MLCYILVGITLLFQNVYSADVESKECGTYKEEQPALVLGWGRSRPLPWHVSIYSKTFKPYKVVCAGSLVTEDKIISVAHCFWSEERAQAAPAAEFAAAVGKQSRPWDNGNENDAQKSDIKQIHLPPRFAGLATHLQDNIALLVVSQPFTVNDRIRPVCLNFDNHFEKLQLRDGNNGLIAAWMNSSGRKPALLLTAEMPYVELGVCISAAAPEYREYITTDKFCAGTAQTNTSLCRGDGGAGLAFPTVEQGKERYYLRGVASSASLTDTDGCAASYNIFTQLSKHEHFLKQLLD